MDDVALEATRAAFDVSNALAGWATIIVALGVFIEFIVLFIFAKEMDRREKVAVAFATALIVIGVIGEWWFGGQAAMASEALQRDAATKAANAIRDAAQASERAGKFEAAAAAAGNAAAMAQKDAAGANERAANLEREAAAANERAAEIMKATAWRQFSQRQKEQLILAFSQHTGKVVIAWIANDAESFALATQFQAILDALPNKDQWDVTFSVKTYPTAVVWDIAIPESVGAPETTKILRDSFTQSSIKFSTGVLPEEGMAFGSPGGTTDRAIILFGSKKPTFGQPPR